MAVAIESGQASQSPIASLQTWRDELWDEDERKAWRPPENPKVWEWAARKRYLSRRQSPRCPGRWNDRNQPILRGIMEVASRRSVRELWIKKSGQLGVSEAIRNVIGCRAEHDPLPALLVLPDEKKGREIIRKRIIPLFTETDSLAELLTGRRLDFKLTAISLVNGFDFQLGWAGSPTSLKSDPMGLVILDEVDAFQPLAGRESDAVSLARARLRTLEKQRRSLLIGSSTPSTDEGPVAQEFGIDDEHGCPVKLFYFVPCPHCGTYQRLTFDRLVFQKFTELIDPARRAAAIKSREAAWFECDNPNCAATHPAEEGKIREAHKLGMLLQGYWGTRDGSWKLYFDGREEGAQPEGDKVGMHAPAFYDVSVTWAAIAAEFVECEGRVEKLQAFYNNTLGETFKLHVGGPATASVFERMCTPDSEKGFAPPPEKQLQPWVSRLLMTVDTQKDHFYWVIRGYGPHGNTFRSHRVDHGQAATFGDLEEIFYRRAYPYAGNPFPPIRCFKLGIDARGGTKDDRLPANRTQQVYEWCVLDPEFRVPLLGDKPFEQRIKWRRHDYQPARQDRNPFTVISYLWDGTYFRDLLAAYIHATLPLIDLNTGEVLGSVPQWQLNANNDPVYNRHLSNVIKRQVRSGRTRVEMWGPKHEGARHDFHDCEAEQVVMALNMGACSTLPTPEQMARVMTPPPVSTGIRMPDGRAYLANQR